MLWRKRRKALATERTLALTLRGPGHLALSVVEFPKEELTADPVQLLFKHLFKPEPLSSVNFLFSLFTVLDISSIEEKHTVYVKAPIPLIDPVQQFLDESDEDEDEDEDETVSTSQPELLSIVNIVLTVPDSIFFVVVNGQVLTPTPEEANSRYYDTIRISADLHTLEFLLKVLQEFVEAYKRGERGIFIDEE